MRVSISVTNYSWPESARALADGTGDDRTLDIPDGGRTIRHKLTVLARHCKSAGRPYDEIEKTVSTRLDDGQSADEFVDHGAELEAVGIEHAVVIRNGPWEDARLATLAAAVPALQDL
jgi:hypothetical protein